MEDTQGQSELDATMPDVLAPGDPGFDEARAVWNGRFESRPAGIVRARGARDVVAALAHARAEGLAVSGKSGGHDYAGNSASRGGLLIDMGGVGSVSIDPDRRRGTVGPGVTWGQLDEAAQHEGLATPGGTVSTVGVAGFTLGGGQGWLTRKHGLACDNLLSAEVVTASGEIVRASESENPDLLWGLRGGGGNLGIVTSFELALHPLDHEILSGQIVYPIDRAAEALRLYRDVYESAPEETMCFPFIYRVPPLEVFPEGAHGDLVIAFVVAYMGPLAEGEAALAPFGSLGGAILDHVVPQAYTTLQRSFDAGMGHGNRWYTRSHDFDVLTDEAIDTLVGQLDPFPGPFTVVYLGPGGGAVARRAPDATAYSGRGVAHYVHVFPGWIDAAQDESIMSWTRGVSDAMAPHATGGVYVNLLGEDETARIPASYGSNFERLARLKAKWDPDNILSGNHNVAPET